MRHFTQDSILKIRVGTNTVLLAWQTEGGYIYHFSHSELEVGLFKRHEMGDFLNSLDVAMQEILLHAPHTVPGETLATVTLNDYPFLLSVPRAPDREKGLYQIDLFGREGMPLFTYYRDVISFNELFSKTTALADTERGNRVFCTRCNSTHRFDAPCRHLSAPECPPTAPRPATIDDLLYEYRRQERPAYEVVHAAAGGA
jgi:hypothetical protein